MAGFTATRTVRHLYAKFETLSVLVSLMLSHMKTREKGCIAESKMIEYWLQQSHFHEAGCKRQLQDNVAIAIAILQVLDLPLRWNWMPRDRLLGIPEAVFGTRKYEVLQSYFHY